MKFRLPSSLFVALVIAAAGIDVVCEARRPSGGRGNAPRGSRGPSSIGRSGNGRGSSSSSSKRGPSSSQGGPPSSSRRRPVDDYEEEPEEDAFDFKFPGDEYDEEEPTGNGDGGGYDYEDENEYDEYDAEEDLPPRRGGRPVQRQSSSRGPPPPNRRGKPAAASRANGRTQSSRGSSSSRLSGRSPPSRGRGGRPSSSRGGRQSDRVVPYGNRRSPQPGAFSRGIAALRESIPDPTAIKETAFSSINAARETTSKLSSNLYREIKGLTSSELEQVMLKATQPNDVAVKGSHVERLVGVTYQISGRYDIYDAVLRKLWSKMIEKDWRTNIKALYILHKFSADGAPDHQAALKARLRELRRTRDPKRKEKYFNSKQLLAGDSTPANIAFRAFLGRYAHYVLLRAQCFGGVFSEIGNDPNDAKNKPKRSSSRQQSHHKCITATCLKNEHLEAAQMLLKAGLACALKEEEECENTAIALERVVSDLIGLTTATATALKNALTRYDGDEDLDRALVKKWCEFYSDDLLPQTKAMMKSTSPTLDAYGLFLPSRMGATVSQDLLQKALKGGETQIDDESQKEGPKAPAGEDGAEKVQDEPEETEEEAVEDDFEDDRVYDEYEYDEYEYDEY